MTVSELSDYITRRKKIKSQYLNEVQNSCTQSRISIAFSSAEVQKSTRNFAHGLELSYIKELTKKTLTLVT